MSRERGLICIGSRTTSTKMSTERTQRLHARPWGRINERVGTANSRAESQRALPVVLVVALLALGTVVALTMSQGAAAGDVGVMLMLVGVGAVAEALPFEAEGKGAVGSAALVPYSAAVLVAPGLAVVLAIAVVQLLSQLYHRRGVVKGVFNVAQSIFSIGAAVLLLRVLGVADQALAALSFPQTIARTAPAALVAFSATVVINKLSVAAVVSAATGAEFAKLVSIAVRNGAGIMALQMVFGIYLAWLASHLGIIGAAGMALPLLAMRQLMRNTIQLTRVTEELLDLMVAAIEARDPYTSGHSKRVAAAATKIAKAAGLSAAEVERVQVAALLHDVGKIHEEFARVLSKEGRLTPEEWEIMKRHPVRSAELVGLVSTLLDVVPAVRHHHENWDGTGYPDGRRGEEIPFASRVIMFADTLDAITTDRPYRKALDPDEARKEFIKFRGKQFDPVLCDVVLSDKVWFELYASAKRERGGEERPAVA